MAPTPFDDAAAAVLADDGAPVAEPPFEASPPATVPSESAASASSIEEAEPQVEVVVKDAFAADAPFILGYAGPGGEIVEFEISSTPLTVDESVGARLKESTVVKYVGEDG